jgi:hypothetical protein
MTTNSKDFRVKNGLVVEGTTATVDGQQILTTASSINDFLNVSVGSVQDGDQLSFSTDSGLWVPSNSSGPPGPQGDPGPTGEVGPQGEPGRFSVSESPPLLPENGDGWLDSTSGLLYMYYQDQNSSQWIGLGGSEKGDPGEQGPRGESGAEVEMSATAPAGEIEPGTLWYDSEDGSTYIYFSNSTNPQWVQL